MFSRRYQVIQVKCCLYDGEWVTAETLIAAPSNLGDPHGVLPSQRYINILREGEPASPLLHIYN